MARFNRRWVAGAAKADSKWEGRLRDTLLVGWEHQAEKVPYTVPHNYTPDFQKDKILIETKGRFRERSEATKYVYVRDSLPSDMKLVFIFYNPETPMPHAKARKDGTKQTHADWAERNGFEWYREDNFPY